MIFAFCRPSRKKSFIPEYLKPAGGVENVDHIFRLLCKKLTYIAAEPDVEDIKRKAGPISSVYRCRLMYHCLRDRVCV